jgi:Protein kinase C terminal domain
LSLSEFLFCAQKSRTDASNFDKDFTSEEPVLTAVDPTVLGAINQDEFAGFSFVNDDFGKVPRPVATTSNGSPLACRQPSAGIVNEQLSGSGPPADNTQL